MHLMSQYTEYTLSVRRLCKRYSKFALPGLDVVCNASPVSSLKDLTPPSLTIVSGTQYAWGKSGYFKLISRVYGEITLLIGCIQDRLIDLQASLD